ncbi:MAG: cupredoxin domain-containing protein [Gammaproteobacteria bacterium]|nr:cupredoxin domain-containing protein [Gammaproteobacteria bacterium]
MNRVFVLACLAIGLVAAGPVVAGEPYTLTIRDHRFEPTEITIPADTRVKLVVKNLDATPEEFESYELNREKIIAGGSQAIIYIGPVSAGRYRFFGEFHQDTAQGVIVAK